VALVPQVQQDRLVNQDQMDNLELMAVKSNSALKITSFNGAMWVKPLGIALI
jgi:hypothetical protein